MDISAAISELAEAYRANRVAKETIRAEVREKYRVIQREEIRERQLENDVVFARRLARVKEEVGLTLRQIQDEVLRTRTWSTWKYWEGLAGLVPARVSAVTSRQEQQAELSPFRQDEDGTLWLKRNAEGPVEEFPLEVVRSGSGVVAWPPVEGGSAGYAEFRKAFGSMQEASAFLAAAVRDSGSGVDWNAAISASES